MGKTLLPPVEEGQRIWEWTVVDASLRIEYGGRMRRAALVRCSCSTSANVVEKTATWDHLRSGNDKSCGHYRAEWAVQHSAELRAAGKLGYRGGHVTHGLSGQRLYKTWSAMKDRCRNPDDENYGGRGIEVCPEWRDDFQAFHDCVTQLDHYGVPGRTLDRYPDRNGNYEPGNVRWATAEDQSQNTRVNVATAGTVRAIRALWASTQDLSRHDPEKWTMRRLSAAFGITLSTTASIVYRETWKNV